MGFGKKTDFATGRMLDLDKTYKYIIKPAITAAGYDCVPADEEGSPDYEMLFTADLVVADLSTSDANATYELGVRHALKPRATIVIAEDQFKRPFDINHIVIRPYVHLGTDIGFDEIMRMRQDLQTLATALKTNQAVDSPVYTVLSDLQQPTRKLAMVATTYRRGGGECRELRLACVHKEELGEQGQGNCRRYRQVCRGSY
jgi:hypothetical protein